MLMDNVTIRRSSELHYSHLNFSFLNTVADLQKNKNSNLNNGKWKLAINREAFGTAMVTRNAAVKVPSNHKEVNGRNM